MTSTFCLTSFLASHGAGCMSSSCNWAAPARFKGVDTDQEFLSMEMLLSWDLTINVWGVSRFPHKAIDRCNCSWLALSMINVSLTTIPVNPRQFPTDSMDISWCPWPEESVFVEVFLQVSTAESAWKTLLGPAWGQRLVEGFSTKESPPRDFWSNQAWRRSSETRWSPFLWVSRTHYIFIYFHSIGWNHGENHDFP